MACARRPRRSVLPSWLFAASGLLGLVVPAVARASEVEGSVELIGIRMDPYGQDAKRYSRASWGGGLQVVVPMIRPMNMLAGVVGFEIVNFLSETTVFRDPATQLRVEQQTSQDYTRFYLGSELGGHGHGFLQPHAGASVALVNYGIHTDVVVPDDTNREKEIRQNLATEGHFAFGYDLRGGLALNFQDLVLLDGGVRYLESFQVPQQLGDRAVTVHPAYFQYYLGVGTTFDAFRRGK